MRNDQGTIRKALSGFYYVQTDDGLVTCRARGKFRYQKITPLVGDRVAITVQDDGSGSLDHILPRRNAFQRPAVANLDQLVIIASGAIPVTDPFLIDRMISIAESKECQPSSCASTSGIWCRQRTCSRSIRPPASRPCPVSADTGEGIEELRRPCWPERSRPLPATPAWESPASSTPWSRTSAWPAGRDQRKAGPRPPHHPPCGAVPRWPRGLIADTPGFSAFDTEKGVRARWTRSTLDRSFREFRPYLGQCRFIGCAHVKEKGCAVLAAVKAGDDPHEPPPAAMCACTSWRKKTNPGKNKPKHDPSVPCIHWGRRVCCTQEGGKNHEDGGHRGPEGLGGLFKKDFPHGAHRLRKPGLTLRRGT